MEKNYIDPIQKIIGIPGDQFPSGQRFASHVHKVAKNEFQIKFVPSELVGDIVKKHKKELLQYDYLIFFTTKNDKSFGDFTLVMFQQVKDDFIAWKYETGLHDLWHWTSKVIFILVEHR